MTLEKTIWVLLCVGQTQPSTIISKLLIKRMIKLMIKLLLVGVALLRIAGLLRMVPRRLARLGIVVVGRAILVQQLLPRIR